MSTGISNSEDSKADLWVLSCKMRGMAHLIKYQSAHSLLTEQVLFGIGELICDLAATVDAIREAEELRS